MRTTTNTELVTAVATLADLRVIMLINNVSSDPIALPLSCELAAHSVADVDAIVFMNARSWPT